MRNPELFKLPDSTEVGMTAVGGLSGAVIVGGLAAAESGVHLVESIPTRLKIHNLNGDIDSTQSAENALFEQGVPPNLSAPADKFLNAKIQDKKTQIAVETKKLPDNPGLKEVGGSALEAALLTAAATFVAVRGILSVRYARDKRQQTSQA